MKMSVAQNERGVDSGKAGIYFPEGVIGFSEYKYFRVSAEKSKEPFFWLEAVDHPELSFIVINPCEFSPDYRPALSPTDRAELQLECEAQCRLLVIVHVPEDSENISANMLAPLAINESKNIGKQVILQDQNYPLQHLILDEMLKGLGEEDVSPVAQAK